MTAATIQVVPLHPQMGRALPWPARASAQAAGFDVVAAIDEAWVLAPGSRRWLPTGLALQLPAGTEAQVRPRSGLAGRHGITCLNTPGTIDADYRGEVKVLLANLGEAPFTVEPGMRIAQLVFAALLPVQLDCGPQPLSPTQRGSQGFGSTGT